MAKYFFSDGTNQFGPFTVDELRGKSVGPQTSVWCEGMPGWQPASTVQEIAPLMAAHGPPPMNFQPAPSVVPPPKNVSLMTCAVCNGTVAMTAATCPHCGAPVSSQPETNPAKPKQSVPTEPPRAETNFFDTAGGQVLRWIFFVPFGLLVAAVWSGYGRGS